VYFIIGLRELGKVGGVDWWNGELWEMRNGKFLAMEMDKESMR
jgi:hypothetical protein